jgi:hypothetical protein
MEFDFIPFEKPTTRISEALLCLVSRCPEAVVRDFVVPDQVCILEVSADQKPYQKRLSIDPFTQWLSKILGLELLVDSVRRVGESFFAVISSNRPGMYSFHDLTGDQRLAGFL